MAKKKTENAEKKVDLRRLKKDERPAPTTGQSGPEMHLPAEKINKDERQVLQQLDVPDRGSAMIVQIADAIKKAKRNSFTTLQTRNALRRLVRGGLVSNKDRGEYKITAKGSKVASVLDSVPLPAKGAKSAKPKATATKKAKKEPKAAKMTKGVDTAPKGKKARGKKLGVSPETDDLDEAPPKHESTTSFSDEVETELAQFGGDFKRTDPHYKGAILVAAIRTAGVSDTKIAKVTGLSRGFCMPRVKRLKAAGVLSAPGTDDEFKAAVAIAEGAKSNGHRASGPDDEPEGEPEPEEMTD